VVLHRKVHVEGHGEALFPSLSGLHSLTPTVFAPHNEALPGGDALADFVVSEPLDDLRNVLLYHVVPGRIESTDLVDGARLTTLAGTEIVSSTSAGARVNNANIILSQANLVTNNGVIHAIDNLLYDLPNAILMTVMKLLLKVWKTILVRLFVGIK
jgi:uncharacterized surface protein with fasciclin (FAS1) repeats